MPIYEFFCSENNTIYQFYAKSIAQGKTTPKCPDHPRWKLKKIVSSFALTSGAGDTQPEPAVGSGADPAEDSRMEAAMGAMEKEFSSVDENDPRAMGRMMRRMAELSGEKIDGEMEEVVRKLEEGADPESLEEQLGDDGGAAHDADDPMGGASGDPASEAGEKDSKFRYRAKAKVPRRDPKLYDYD